MKNYINVDALRIISQKLTPSGIAKSMQVASGEALVARWWNKKPNWGNTINPVLIRSISGKPVYHKSEVLSFNSAPVYNVVGSTLNGIDDGNLVVWGSGFMHRNAKICTVPRKVTAIRGPLSRDNFKRQGVSCPDVYGDPVLLLPRYMNPSVAAIHILGIIPHYKIGLW